MDGWCGRDQGEMQGPALIEEKKEKEKMSLCRFVLIICRPWHYC